MIVREENSHDFYVMGWFEECKKTAPRAKKKFNIYDDAVEYYNKLTKKLGYVEMFEYIGGKRKMLQNSADVKESKLLCETDDTLINEFEGETGLKLSKSGADDYYESSGAEYEDILDATVKFNKNHKTQIICWYDSQKDIIFIKLS